MNGTSGEGMSLSVEERKQTAERWQKVSEDLKITTMIQIGGAAYQDVIELVNLFFLYYESVMRPYRILNFQFPGNSCRVDQS